MEEAKNEEDPTKEVVEVEEEQATKEKVETEPEPEGVSNKEDLTKEKTELEGVSNKEEDLTKEKTEAEGVSNKEEDLTKEKTEAETETGAVAPACVPCVEVQDPPIFTPPPFKKARIGLQYKTKGLIVREESYDENGFPVALCRCAGVHPTKEGWCRNEDHHFGHNCNNIIDAKNGERRCMLCERGNKAKFKPKRLSSSAAPSLGTSIFCQDIMQAAQEIVDTAYRLARRMEQGRLRQKEATEKPLEGRAATLRSATSLVEELPPKEPTSL